MDNITANTLDMFNKKGKINLSELNVSLNLLIPRADLFSTISSKINRISINEVIKNNFKDGLMNYLLKMNEQDLLGNGGAVVNPISYICRFNNLELDYYWIPKNACTFAKKNFAILDGKEKIEYEKNKFHEGIQKDYGLSMMDYIDDKNKGNKKIVIIREPIERIVSCYIDKFAKPCIENRNYEPYIKSIINNIYDRFNIDAIPEERSISFYEFINYIMIMPVFSRNEHWRPQADFIRNIKFDYILKQNQLIDGLNKIGYLQLSQNKKENSSIGLSYTKGKSKGELAESYPSEINLEKVYDYSQFITPSLELLLFEIYKEDFVLYNEIV